MLIFMENKPFKKMGAVTTSPRTIRENNFDLLRLLLAFTVFLGHCYALTGSSALRFIDYVLNSERAIQGFFVISGFLIFMSYEKSRSIVEYYKKRVRRLYPAYAFAIIYFLIAFSLISTERFANYFTSIKLYKYLIDNLLFLNFLQPSLPGVFQDHINSAVNGALWTLKIEVMFYVSVPFIVFLLRRFDKRIVFAAIYILSCLYLYCFRNIYISEILARQLPGQLSYFCAGGMCYYYSEYFQKYSSQLILMAIAGYIAHYFINMFYLLPIIMSIIVIYFAISFYYLGNFGKYGDVSYGVYIYHFPIIQLLIWFGIFKYNPFIGVIIAAIILILLSLFSWHFIEKKYLLRSSHYINAAIK